MKQDIYLIARHRAGVFGGCECSFFMISSTSSIAPSDRSADGNGRWTTELFDCLKDEESCKLRISLPCVLFLSLFSVCQVGGVHGVAGF
jgi:hypothetical protein